MMRGTDMKSFKNPEDEDEEEPLEAFTDKKTGLPVPIIK
jgi:hypothetical protein